MTQFKAVAEKGVSKFEEVGIICPRGLFEAQYIDCLHQATEVCMANPREIYPGLAEWPSEKGWSFKLYRNTTKPFIILSSDQEQYH